MEILYGLHPVEEALRSGSRRFDYVCIARERGQAGHDQRLAAILDLCRKAAVKTRLEPRDALTRMARTSAHQGIVAVVREREFLDLEDLLEAPAPGLGQGSSGHGSSAPAAQARLVLALDGIEDPQNFGALLRSAEAAGVDGVFFTERRSAPLSPVAVKASAGAAEHLRLARVVNIVRSLEALKERNLWCVGLDERGDQDYDRFDFTSNTVIVLGREGAGLHDLVRRTCDHLLRIPMAGKVASLNVSAAGAIVLFEAARQRRAAALPTPAPKEKAPRKIKGLGS